MKSLIYILIIAIIGSTLQSCNGNNSDNLGPYADLELNSFKDRISYGIGADVGANFNNFPPEQFRVLVPEALEEGFHSGLSGQEPIDKACQTILGEVFAVRGKIDTTLHDMAVVSSCYGFIFGEMLRKNLQGKDAMEEIDLEVARKGFAQALVEVDTLIPFQERSEMVANFNNDMSKSKGKRFMNQAYNLPDIIKGEKGWVLQTLAPGNGEVIDPTKEFQIVYTLMNAVGDTITTTFVDEMGSDKINSQIINTDDIVIPNGWVEAAPFMEVGGEYLLYLPYELGFGEYGLLNRNSTSYIIQPYSAILISTKVLEQNELHGTAKKQGEQVIAEAKKKPNTRVGKSGYVLETLREGTGDKVPAGSDVRAHYILRDSKGNVIEDSYAGASQGRGVPAFSLQGVIKGWQEAVPEMRKGGKYKLYLPYFLAYGENGNQNIPPYETLVFEMEIIDFGKQGSLTGR